MSERVGTIRARRGRGGEVTERIYEDFLLKVRSFFLLLVLFVVRLLFVVCQLIIHSCL